MIPVKLILEGLYSYQKKQEIDFRTLCGAGLFGIFGAVGSGKSSVLEALTFALYGRTDRLNQAGDNRYYNMMNLKSDELLIDFEFESGPDQTPYRALVQAKRNRRRFEEVNTPDRRAFRKTAGAWQAIGLDELEAAVGLSYENFKRTIIIPQGRFQEFLQLGTRDRTQMMKELFHLQRFELFRPTATLLARTQAELQNVEGQLQQLEQVNPEVLKEQETQLKVVQEKTTQLHSRLQKWEQEEASLRELQRLSAALQKARTQLAEKEKQRPQMEQRQKELDRYEICKNQFAFPLEQVQQGQQSLEKQQVALHQLEQKLQKTQEQEARLTVELEKLKPAYEQREHMKLKAADLEVLQGIRQSTLRSQQQKERLQKGEQVVQEVELEWQRRQEEKTALDKAIKQLKEVRPDLLQLSQAQQWHRQQVGLQKDLEGVAKQLKQKKAEHSREEAHLQTLQRKPLFADYQGTADVAGLRTHLVQQKEKIQNRLKALQKQGEEQRLQAQLQTFSEHLQDGTPCPLCGAESHPHRYSATEAGERLQRLEQEQLSLEKEQRNIEVLSAELVELDSRLRHALKAQEEVQQRQKDLQAQMEAEQKAFKWPQWKEAAAVEKALAQVQQADKELRQKEHLQEQLQKQLEQGSRDKERYRSEVEKIKQALAGETATLVHLRAQLKQESEEGTARLSETELKVEQERLMKEYQRLEQEHQRKTAALHAQQQESAALKGRAAADRRHLQELEKDLAQRREALLRQVADSPFADLGEVRQVLALGLDIPAEKARLTTFWEDWRKEEHSLKSLEQELGQRTYQAEVHQALQEHLKAARAELEQQHKEEGRLNEALRKLREALSSQKKLMQQAEKLRERAEHLGTLKQLFNGSGFVSYISSVYLQNLCAAANERFFHLTRQQLSLELTPDNNFEVRDFLNGGKVRSVKTLSGGQTFQAALCLALALADNIQQITRSNQNFFFLDEGFGSLDKEALAVVFDTLKALRQENRTVGLISHVEEMQQEVEVHLRVENHEEQGSIIRSSWTT
ncbi:MAG TPA: SMC family ATPase [Bacteroidales bacterium]|nr:SMC family ATPase [Bacteroidales bacterium]